jgi:hypothetical protein
MNFFYLSLIIGGLLLVFFMSYATYDSSMIESSYRLAIQQNEDKFNPDVEWIGNKVTTIFDDSIAYETIAETGLLV